MGDQSWWETPLKYFFHGISFSILLLLLGFLWAFILGILVVLGYLIGLIIGFVLLLIFVGGINSFLSDFFWDISTSTDWKSLLGHGFILFIALFIVDIPAVLVNLYVPSLVTSIAVFIIYAFISGFIARKVAAYWEQYHEE